VSVHQMQVWRLPGGGQGSKVEPKRVKAQPGAKPLYQCSCASGLTSEIGSGKFAVKMAGFPM